LDFLKNTGLSFVRLRGLSEGNPENAVCLTFDDGYLSFYEEVFPTLIDRSIPAAVFIPTDYVGKKNTWDVTFGINRRWHLSWNQLRELRESGIEIGSHGRTHHDLRKLRSERLQNEIEISKKTLEDGLGVEITALALPFGGASVDVFRVARQIGYQEICGGVPGIGGPIPGILPRMPVYRGDRIRAIRKKLELNIAEGLKLKVLQGCSIGTRWIKTLP
jgi:peptidoglycan/xylan/chitin deacetylase (PgdA/CDA1 family)